MSENTTETTDVEDVEQIDTPRMSTGGRPEGPDLNPTRRRPETFPREVVEKLRQENGKYRQRAQQADASPDACTPSWSGRQDDWPIPPIWSSTRNTSTTPTPWRPRSTTARPKPHLATRRPAGDIGQGQRARRLAVLTARLAQRTDVNRASEKTDPPRCGVRSGSALRGEHTCADPVTLLRRDLPGLAPNRLTSWRRVEPSNRHDTLRTFIVAIEVTSGNTTLIQSQVASLLVQPLGAGQHVPGRRPRRPRLLQPGPGAAHRQRRHRRVRRRRRPDHRWRRRVRRSHPAALDTLRASRCW